jgi:hypothetical protein
MRAIAPGFGATARRAMITVEFLKPKRVSETIKDLGQEHLEPRVWLPAGTHAAVVYVGSPTSDGEWLIVTNRKTGERVKVTL